MAASRIYCNKQQMVNFDDENTLKHILKTLTTILSRESNGLMCYLNGFAHNKKGNDIDACPYQSSYFVL